MDKFFYDTWWDKDEGKFCLQLYIEDAERGVCVEFDDREYFDTQEEMDEHRDNLPDFAYHIEQFGDV